MAPLPPVQTAAALILPGTHCALDQKSSRLAVPEGIPLSLFKPPALTMAFRTVAGDAPELFCRKRAATPAT